MGVIRFLGQNARWLASAFILTFFSTAGQTSFIGGSAGFIRHEYGLSNGQWGLIFMAGTLASALTLPYLGAFVDRYPPRRMVLGLVEAQWAPFGFMALVGMSAGLSTTMFSAFIPEVYGLKHLGSIRAVIFSCSVLASAAGPGVTGLLIDRGVSYPGQLIAMGLYCFPVSLLLAWVVRKVRIRNLQSRSA